MCRQAISKKTKQKQKYSTQETFCNIQNDILNRTALLFQRSNFKNIAPKSSFLKLTKVARSKNHRNLFLALNIEKIPIKPYTHQTPSLKTKNQRFAAFRITVTESFS